MTGVHISLTVKKMENTIDCEDLKQWLASFGEFDMSIKLISLSKCRSNSQLLVYSIVYNYLSC